LRVSHSTVNAVRKDLESDGQLVQQKTIITKDGKARPRKALEDSGKKNETGNNGAESRNEGDNKNLKAETIPESKSEQISKQEQKPELKPEPALKPHPSLEKCLDIAQKVKRVAEEKGVSVWSKDIPKYLNITPSTAKRALMRENVHNEFPDQTDHLSVDEALAMATKLRKENESSNMIERNQKGVEEGNAFIAWVEEKAVEYGLSPSSRELSQKINIGAHAYLTTKRYLKALKDHPEWNIYLKSKILELYKEQRLNENQYTSNHTDFTEQEKEDIAYMEQLYKTVDEAYCLLARRNDEILKAWGRWRRKLSRVEVVYELTGRLEDLRDLLQEKLPDIVEELKTTSPIKNERDGYIVN